MNIEIKEADALIHLDGKAAITSTRVRGDNRCPPFTVLYLDGLKIFLYEDQAGKIVELLIRDFPGIAPAPASPADLSHMEGAEETEIREAVKA